MTLVLNEVVIMGLGMPLIVVLLDEATATQLAPVRVLRAGAKQTAQEAGGGRASAGAGAVATHVVMVVMALTPCSEDVLQQAAIMGW